MPNGGSPNDETPGGCAPRGSRTRAVCLAFGFFFFLFGSFFFFCWIFFAGLTKRTRVELSATRAPIALTHSLLPCSGKSTAARPRYPTAARRSCPGCGHRRLPV